MALTAPFLLFPNRLTVFVLPLLLLSWASRWLALGRFSLSATANMPVLFLLVASVAALYPSVDPGVSSSKVWGITLGVWIFFALVNTIRSVTAFRRMLWVLLFGGALVALIGLLGTDWRKGAIFYLPWLYDHIPTLIRNVPGSGIPNTSDLFNAREVGGTMAMMLPLGVALALVAHSSRAKAMALGASLGIGLVLLLTQSPSAVLGGSMGVILVVGAWRGRLRPAIWLACLLLLFSTVAFLWALAATSQRFAAEVEIRSSFGLLSRLEIWHSALLMIRDMPFTGIGINTFPLVMDGFYPAASLGLEPHAHNIFLQVALDLGVLGFFAFLWLLTALYSTIKAAYRAFADKELRTAIIALGASVAAYLVFGSIDAITLGAKPGAALWAVIGLVGVSARLSAGVRSEASVQTPGVTTIGVIALLILAPLVWHGYSGGLWLDLGLVDAHKGVTQARDRRGPPMGLLTRAESRLTGYLAKGGGNYQAYAALSSVQGWLGKDREAVESMKKATSRATSELLLSMGFLVGARDNDIKATEVGFLYNQWEARFQARWEVYLMKAQFLAEELGDAARAQAVLKEGMARSDLKGPLQEYLKELSQR